MTLKKSKGPECGSYVDTEKVETDSQLGSGATQEAEHRVDTTAATRSELASKERWEEPSIGRLSSVKAGSVIAGSHGGA